MKSFFDTVYYFTNGFYNELLDSYLYDTIPGYLYTGIFLLLFSFIVSALFYYAFAPVRRQTFWWFIYGGINIVLNIGVALYYTMTPLINNEIEADKAWTYLDCFGFCIANLIWSCISFVIASLIIKWGSIDKYVPFQKF